MTRETVNQITSSACGFSAFMLGMSEKLTRENREPTEREATEICEQLEAVRQVAQPPKSGELPYIKLPCA